MALQAVVMDWQLGSANTANVGTMSYQLKSIRSVGIQRTEFNFRTKENSLT